MVGITAHWVQLLAESRTLSTLPSTLHLYLCTSTLYPYINIPPCSLRIHSTTTNEYAIEGNSRQLQNFCDLIHSPIPRKLVRHPPRFLAHLTKTNSTDHHHYSPAYIILYSIQVQNNYNYNHLHCRYPKERPFDQPQLKPVTVIYTRPNRTLDIDTPLYTNQTKDLSLYRSQSTSSPLSAL